MCVGESEASRRIDCFNGDLEERSNFSEAANQYVDLRIQERDIEWEESGVCIITGFPLQLFYLFEAYLRISPSTMAAKAPQ